MLNRIKMEVKMHLITLTFLLVLHVVAFGAVSYVFLPKGYMYNSWKFVESSAISYLNPDMPLEFKYQGEMMKATAGRLEEGAYRYCAGNSSQIWKIFLS